MANWSNPVLGTTYSTFLTELDARLDELAVQFNGTTPTNQPPNSIKWNDTSKIWEKWNGSTWGALATTYGITATAAVQLATARTIALSNHVSGNVSFNGTSNVTISATLATSGVTAATYGNATSIPQFTVDTYGRITSANTQVSLGTMASQSAGSVAITGGSISGTGITLLGGTGSNTEGVMQWHTTNDQLLIGRGASIGTISPDDKATTLTNKTMGASCSFSVDLPISTGVLTTTNTTGSLFNTNATTINLGGAGTTFTVGAASDGIMTIRLTRDVTSTTDAALVVSGGIVAGKLIRAVTGFQSYGDFTSQSKFDLGGIHNGTNVQIYGSNITVNFNGGSNTTVMVGKRQVITINPVNTTASAMGAYANYSDVILGTNAGSIGAVYGNWSRLTTNASALTGAIQDVYMYMAGAPNYNASTTTNVTNYRAFHAANYTKGTLQTDPTLVIGYSSILSSGTGRWNFYASGTANNYFNGKILIGSTTDAGLGALEVTGIGYFSAGVIASTIYTSSTTANVMNVNSTTVNIGGAATSIISGSTGATTHTLRGTGAVTVPSGTTAQRPGSGVNGMVRYNSTDLKLEGYIGSTWRSLATNDTVQTVWIPASSMIPQLTDGATSDVLESTNKIMYDMLSFADAVTKYAQFNIRMPKGWDEGTVTAEFIFTINSTATGNIVWAIDARAISSGETRDPSSPWGTAQTLTVSKGATAVAIIHSGPTAALTIGGTPVENDFVVFRVYRDGANASDTYTGDGRLIGVVLKYTTSLMSDA